MATTDQLPVALGAALRPELPGLADEVIAAIGREVEDYARPLEGPFGRALRMGVERALTRFVDAIEEPAVADDPAARATYVGLGMLEYQSGRSLDALLSAYRLGARMAWERFVAAGEAAGHEPATLFRLAGAIFTYIDRISAESVEGYTAEQRVDEAERQRRRRALVRLLAMEDAGPEEVRDLAREAGWPRPSTVAGLVAADDAPDRLAGRLGGGAIAAGEDGLALVVVPDPDAPLRREQLRAALGETVAAIGPTVPLERAARSLARAQAALRLAATGVIDTGDGLVEADDHLLELLLEGDAALAADLATRALAPLEELAPGPRERLAATLAVWLDHPGHVRRVAGELHVHPQTVRYRLVQLRELFGERLEDPQSRFELSVALRIRQRRQAA